MRGRRGIPEVDPAAIDRLLEKARTHMCHREDRAGLEGVRVMVMRALDESTPPRVRRACIRQAWVVLVRTLENVEPGSVRYPADEDAEDTGADVVAQVGDGRPGSAA